ncbi:MAG: ELWxxDGT repeat protein [Bacteroidota bacterium]
MKKATLNIRLVLYVFAILSVCRTEAQFYKVSLVKDINPGATGSNPGNLTFCNDKLYFTANDGTAGTELWRSDGTSAGTTLVSDINNGATGSNPIYLTAIDFNLFFTANNGTHGFELWRYQTAGAGTGTYLVKDIANGATSSGPSELINMDGTLLFNANNYITGKELWKSNGTSAGTVLAADIWPFATGSNPRDFIKVGNRMYFHAEYNEPPPIPPSAFWYDLTTFERFGVEMYQRENVNGILFYTKHVSNQGIELHSAGGLVKDIYPGSTGGFANSSSPNNLTKFNGGLYFSARTATDTALWKSDGTDAGTVKIKAFPGNTSIGRFFPVNGIMYFTITSPDQGNELWKTDGTATGTELVKDIFPGTGSSSPYNFCNFNGTFYFTADDGIHGRELWRSDGTEAGTYIVEDIWDGSAGSNPSHLAVVDDQMFFAADDGINGIELWKVKNCPNIALATASSTNITQDVMNHHFFNGTSCNNLVASIEPYGGATSITGNATARLWNQAVQPIDYVKRHYQITPATNAATATARVTLYFTDAEFNAFNTQSPAPTRLLPVSTATSVQIAERKGYLRIEKRGGSSSNSSGLPITYPGSVETINPDDADIVWNATNSFWEVTFNVTTGFSGFYVKTRTDILPSTYTFTGDGNWDVPANWQYGAMPPPALTKGSEIIINPGSGSCNLNIQYTVPSGVKITVKTGKTFQVNGNLTIHQAVQ